MELKLTFDGRSLIIAVISIACFIGGAKGFLQSKDAYRALSDAQEARQTIKEIGSGTLDLTSMSLQEKMAIGAVGFQLTVDPHYLDDLEAQAKEFLGVGIFLIIISAGAFLALMLYCKKNPKKLGSQSNEST